MKKALGCIWLLAFLVCLAFGASYRGAWREFARSPVEADAEITGYAGREGSNYAFRVSKQVYRGTGRSPETGENMFVGRMVKVYYCASDPTLNALTPPREVPDAYVKARFSDYVGGRMFLITFILAWIYWLIDRARNAEGGG